VESFPAVYHPNSKPKSQNYLIPPTNRQANKPHFHSPPAPKGRKQARSASLPLRGAGVFTQHDIPHPKYETTSPKRKRRGIHETGANFKTAGVARADRTARADMLLFCRTSNSLPPCAQQEKQSRDHKLAPEGGAVYMLNNGATNNAD